MPSLPLHDSIAAHAPLLAVLAEQLQTEAEQGTEPEADTLVMIDEARDALRGLVRNDDLARLCAYLAGSSTG